VSTHRTFCVICGIDVYCSGDNHALGSGGQHGEGGCDNPPYIEFCSLEHALELQRRLASSIDNYRHVHGTCDSAKCDDCRALRHERPRAYPKRSIMPDDDIFELGFDYFFERAE
jgi:hypothetical protein